jgi:hypothetical protein
MLAYWLPNSTHTLPVNATHRVGVGAFVMNDKREVPNEYESTMKDPDNHASAFLSYLNRL